MRSAFSAGDALTARTFGAKINLSVHSLANNHPRCGVKLATYIDALRVSLQRVTAIRQDCGHG